jgi:hypothetical protein
MAATNQTGFQMMQRSGDQNQLDSQNQQQLIAMLLKNALAAPQRPELSWTQGLARMVEAGASAYMDNKQEQKNKMLQEQSSQDSQLLGAALSSNDPRAIVAAMQRMKNPQSQSMAMNLLANMQAQNQLNTNEINKEQRMSGFRREEQKQKYGHDLGKADFESALQSQNKDQQNQFDLTKEGVKSALDTNRDSSKIREEATKDPIKNAQANVFQMQKVIDNPNADDSIKALAKKKLESNMAILSELKTNADPNAVAMNGTGLAGNGRMAGGSSGSSGTKSAGAAPDIQAAARSAQDLLGLTKNVLGSIESGKLSNGSMTALGQFGNYVAEANDLQSSSPEIGAYKQLSAKNTLQAIKDYMASGGPSRMSKALIDIFEKSALDPNDLPGTSQPKIFMLMQAADRAVARAQLQTQWVDKNGGIDRKDPSGQTYQQVENKFFDANPIVSYGDYLKNNRSLIMTQQPKTQSDSQNPDAESSQSNNTSQEPAPTDNQKPLPVSKISTQPGVSQGNSIAQNQGNTTDDNKFVYGRDMVGSDEDSPQYKNSVVNPSVAQNTNMTRDNIPEDNFKPNIDPSQRDYLQNVNYGGSPLMQNQQPQQPQMDQGQMLAALLARKQQESQQAPDYSNMNNNNPYTYV